MGPIEHAVMIEAFRLKGTLTSSHRPVLPALDCLAQAIREVCQEHGFSTEKTHTFLLHLGSRIHSLDHEINDRRQLRAMERQMLSLIGRDSRENRPSRRGRRPQV